MLTTKNKKHTAKRIARKGSSAKITVDELLAQIRSQPKLRKRENIAGKIDEIVYKIKRDPRFIYKTGYQTAERVLHLLGSTDKVMIYPFAKQFRMNVLCFDKQILSLLKKSH